ncbi:type II secretion system F family protein [Botrimarina mediterranea]|uniref:Type II secretion system protein F n=1 Tax=Botrimarina mediterranea TaxID=2528022 RepID=A0A518K975_9BACT|nr:type II secretion system F family protein [Botrimarina mediterranea]QDV74330.1 Type II secretion system protein F [Botrimarina mediterranea]
MFPPEDSSIDRPANDGARVTPAAQIALGTEWRLPLPAMLRALGEEHGGRVGVAIESLADELEGGRSLKAALAEVSPRFPKSLRRQLQMVAEAGGDLSTVLPALSNVVTSERQLRSRLFAIFTYPLLVSTMLVGVILFSSWVLVPEFALMYGSFGLELPAATEFFFWFCRWAPLAILLIGPTVAGLFVMAMTPGLARYVHWFVGSLPFIGPLWTYEGHASLARMLAAYTKARLPLGESLRCAAAGLIDQNLATAALRVARRCDAGKSLADAMSASRHFERDLVGQIREGEEISALPAALESAASSYSAHARRQLEFLSCSLPPLMILLVGGFLMLFVPAIFLPMVKLIEGLS